MNSYERFCFNLLGKRMKAKREDYSQLRNDLISARLKTPFEVYISTALVSSVIVGFGAAFVIGILSWLLKLPALIKYKGAVPGFLVALTPYSLIIGTILITVFSLIIFGGLTYVVFIMYPSVEAGNRRRNIDATLPYAINYVTSMSTAGITPAKYSGFSGTARFTGRAMSKPGISQGRLIFSGVISSMPSASSRQVLRANG